MRLITDRTQADVLEGTEKGRYTLRDLDRVEQTVEDLRIQLHILGTTLSFNTYTGWQQNRTIPTQREMIRYLQNVRAVAEALGLTPELPESMDYLDYRGANQIELALEQAQEKLRSIQQSDR